MDVNELLSRLRALFEYDPTSGIVTRRVARGNAKAFAVVGTQNTHGHLGVEVDGRHHGVHQIAWALHTGEWPEKDIDHRNGKPADNRFKNLRLATDGQNLRNSRDYSKASGLPRGVTKSHAGRFVARITVEHGAGAKYLGTFDSPDAASAEYQAAAAKHFGEFMRCAHAD